MNYGLICQSCCDHVNKPFSTEMTFPTALKNLMQRVLERLMGVEVLLEEDEQDPGMSVARKRVSCSIGSLCQWYKTVVKVRKCLL